MAVLHLPGAVPNAGALRLFGWLAARASMADAIAAIEARTGPGTVQRMIDGTLLPGRELGIALAVATGGAVDARGFRAAPAHRWWWGEFSAVRSRGATDEALRRFSAMPRASSLARPPQPARA